MKKIFKVSIIILLLVCFTACENNKAKDKERTQKRANCLNEGKCWINEYCQECK